MISNCLQKSAICYLHSAAAAAAWIVSTVDLAFDCAPLVRSCLSKKMCIKCNETPAQNCILDF